MSLVEYFHTGCFGIVGKIKNRNYLRILVGRAAEMFFINKMEFCLLNVDRTTFLPYLDFGPKSNFTKIMLFHN